MSLFPLTQKQPLLQESRKQWREQRPAKTLKEACMDVVICMPHFFSDPLPGDASEYVNCLTQNEQLATGPYLFLIPSNPPSPVNECQKAETL
jgi:hypothetical protein